MPPYDEGPRAAGLGATAMVDVSDGLVSDLGHVARASGVSVRLSSEAFHVPQEFQDTARALNADPLQWLLAGGEDHALAATFPPDVDLPMAWSVVGRVDGGRGRAGRRRGLAGAGRLAVVLVVVLTDWTRRAAAHEERVDAWVLPHLDRRRCGQKHPVEDFLFDYYRLSPAELRRWHPGAGVVLAGPDALPYLELADYRQVEQGVAADPRRLARHVRRLRDVRRLLVATGSRPASYGCFGLHEWAMVYRASPDEVRHRAHPLRLAQRGHRHRRRGRADAVHAHRRLPLLHPGRGAAQRAAAEPGQPGRAGAAGLPARRDGPLQVGGAVPRRSVPSELVADCFAHAREIRAVDMRASPYDLAGLGYPPIRVETAAGRAEYVRRQRGFTESGAVLRGRLVAALDDLLDLASDPR